MPLSQRVQVVDSKKKPVEGASVIVPIDNKKSVICMTAAGGFCWVRNLFSKETYSATAYHADFNPSDAVEFECCTFKPPVVLTLRPLENSYIECEDTESEPDTRVNWEVRLVDSGGNGIAYKYIIFYLDGGHEGELECDENGYATVAIEAPADEGDYELKAIFKGDKDYKESECTATLRVEEEEEEEEEITISLSLLQPYINLKLIKHNTRLTFQKHEYCQIGKSCEIEVLLSSEGEKGEYSPVTGATLHFTAGGVTLEDGETNEEGIARTWYPGENEKAKKAEEYLVTCEFNETYLLQGCKKEKKYFVNKTSQWFDVVDEVGDPLEGVQIVAKITDECCSTTTDEKGQGRFSIVEVDDFEVEVHATLEGYEDFVDTYTICEGKTIVITLEEGEEEEFEITIPLPLPVPSVDLEVEYVPAEITIPLPLPVPSVDLEVEYVPAEITIPLSLLQPYVDFRISRPPDIDANEIVNLSAIALFEGVTARYAEFQIAGWTKPPYLCIVCGQRFLNSDDYMGHIVAHIKAYEEGM